MPSYFSAVKSLILTDGLEGVREQEREKGEGKRKLWGNGVPLKKPAPLSHKQRR